MTNVFQRTSHLVGTIDPQCEITPVVVQAYESARFLCEQYYLSAPAMEYTSYDGSTRYVFFGKVRTNGELNGI